MSDAAAFTGSPSLFVLRAGAVGDFILTLPALAALRSRYPHHRLKLAARSDVLPLVHGTLADDVLPIDSPLLTPLFTFGSTLPAELRTFLGHIDLAVVWLPGESTPARVVAENLRRLDAAQLLSASPLPTGQHAAEHLLSTLAPLGIGPQLAGMAPFNLAYASQWSAPWPAGTRAVALHVGSGGAHKRWPVDHFVALARQIARSAGTYVMLLSGPAEEELALSGMYSESNISSVHSLNLPEVAALLKQAKLYIGNDSGISHLAAVLGTPTIALFGPSDPSVWAPRGPHVTIIRSANGQMTGLDVESVWRNAALREALAPTCTMTSLDA